MRYRGLQFILSTVAAILFCSYILYETGFDATARTAEKDAVKDKVLVDVLMTSLKNSHYQPRKVNDSFSENVYDLYLERIDYNKRFFQEADIKLLSKHKLTLDDELNAGTFKFFDESFDLLTKRVVESKKYYQEILSEPFDFSKNEEFELDRDKREFVSNSGEMRERWRKSLKYEALTRIHEMERKQERANEENDTLTLKSFEEMEAKARKNMMKSNDRFFDRMEKWTRGDLQEVYLNSVMNVFGPHTGYFPPKDKENFDISMSGQLEGIGAQLQEKDGYIKVVRIIPGSPSYMQGELEEGDLIIKVAQDGEQPVDITDTRIDDAVKLIRGKKGTKVLLTVKKLSGLIKEIPIVRDIVVLEETYAKSAVIDQGGQKVGYIKLPKFYADFNRLGGRAAASDVEKELNKLKEEGVSGVILDLRGNGGGSLRDAIEMTGHFIESGPVVQVKGRYSKPEIMKDLNKNVVYDGPLVVMLNQFSASASEIVAAAIQDYDRGIILGTSSSFGKGTVQRFFDLDRYLTSSAAQYRPLGAVKVTTQKFYRIDGGATQLRGVLPDIEYPSRYSYFDMGEKEQEYVMEWDEINAVEYSPWSPAYDEASIVSLSEKRMSEDERLQRIEEKAKKLKAQSEETLVSLNYDVFTKKQLALDEQEDLFKDWMEENELEMSVRNVASDLPQFEADSVKREINKSWIDKLKKDFILEEAVHVVGDMEANS